MRCPPIIAVSVRRHRRRPETFARSASASRLGSRRPADGPPPRKSPPCRKAPEPPRSALLRGRPDRRLAADDGSGRKRGQPSSPPPREIQSKAPRGERCAVSASLRRQAGALATARVSKAKNARISRNSSSPWPCMSHAGRARRIVLCVRRDRSVVGAKKDTPPISSGREPIIDNSL